MSSKNPYFYKQNNKNISEKKDTKRSKEAVIKINKKIKCFSDFKKNIKYITRDYQLPLYDDEGYKYEGKEAIKNYIDIYNADGAIPDFLHSRKKEKNEVFNFSSYKNYKR